MSIQDVELVIGGSGLAGYTAAVYAARAGLAPAVLAGSVTAGGALMATTEVENFPGFVDCVQGPELIDAMHAQAERFGARTVYDEATRLDLEGSVKTICTGRSEAFMATPVILAMGSAYRKLGLPEEDRLSGHTYRQVIAAAGTGCAAAQDAQHYRSSLSTSEHRSDLAVAVTA